MMSVFFLALLYHFFFFGLLPSESFLALYIYSPFSLSHAHARFAYVFFDLIQYNEAFALHETIIVKEGVELTKGIFR